MHIGTNHLPLEHPDKLARKIFRLINFINRRFQLAIIHLYGILPKYESNNVNCQIFDMCYNHEHLNVNQHQTCPVNHEPNYLYFWENRRHPSQQGPTTVSGGLH